MESIEYGKHISENFWETFVFCKTLYYDTFYLNKTENFALQNFPILNNMAYMP